MLDSSRFSHRFPQGLVEGHLSAEGQEDPERVVDMLAQCAGILTVVHLGPIMKLYEQIGDPRAETVFDETYAITTEGMNFEAGLRLRYELDRHIPGELIRAIIKLGIIPDLVYAAEVTAGEDELNRVLSETDLGVDEIAEVFELIAVSTRGARQQLPRINPVSLLT